MARNRAKVEISVRQERVARHDRLWNDGTRIDEMSDLPLVEIFSSNASKVRPSAFQAPIGTDGHTYFRQQVSNGHSVRLHRAAAEII